MRPEAGSRRPASSRSWLSLCWGRLLLLFPRRPAAGAAGLAAAKKRSPNQASEAAGEGRRGALQQPKNQASSRSWSSWQGGCCCCCCSSALSSERGSHGSGGGGWCVGSGVAQRSGEAERSEPPGLGLPGLRPSRLMLRSKLRRRNSACECHQTGLIVNHEKHFAEEQIPYKPTDRQAL